MIAKFQNAYAASLKWCENNPDACGAMVAKRVEMLTPEAVADSIRVGQNRFVPADQARGELEAFFQVLIDKQPALVGGKLPDAAFYGTAPQPAKK